MSKTRIALLLSVVTAGLVMAGDAVGNAPVISVPASFSEEGDTTGGRASVTFSAGLGDADPDHVFDGCSPASGSFFPLGATTVTCNAHDAVTGDTSSADFTVTVTDTTAPSTPSHGDISGVEATSPSGADVTFSLSSTDVVDPSPTVSCSPSSGSTFPLGTTTVTCHASDASGNNSGSTSFSVTVVDTIAPTAPSNPDITTEATGPAGADVTFSPTSFDAVANPPSISCTPSSGSTFPLGTTTVSCTASDGPHTTPGSFSVTVQDTTPPSLSAVSSVTAEATGPSGAVVSYATPTATDIVDGPRPVSCTGPASGSTFPLGTTTITCSASDTRNNTSSMSFAVRVVDTEPPAFAGAPGDITADGTSPAGAVVNFSTPTATDGVSGRLLAACEPPSGSTFPYGETIVTCTAVDSSGNRATVSFKVIVGDGPPVFSVATKETVAEATGPDGATVAYAPPTATDGRDGGRPVTCAPAPGSVFPIGSTPVTCSASDTTGHTATLTLTVTVRDTTPPKLQGTPAPIDEDVDGVRSVEVDYDVPTATDVVDGARPVACAPRPGAQFKLGKTTVKCTASDTRGNAASSSFTVTVRDDTPPPAVTDLLVTTDGTRVSLSWKIAASTDVAVVEVVRAPGKVVYRGRKSFFVDTPQGPRAAASRQSLTALLSTLRYTVRSVDYARNRSRPAVAPADLNSPLVGPQERARLSFPPRLQWKPATGAAYYNVQLFSHGRKILSTWPQRPSLQLDKTWRFAGATHELARGSYTWYVWPGLGPRSAGRYGKELGHRTFVITG